MLNIFIEPVDLRKIVILKMWMDARGSRNQYFGFAKQ